MSYCSPFAQEHPRLRRVEQLQTGKMPYAEIAPFIQEIIEAGEMQFWGPALLAVAGHLIEQNMCVFVLNGRVQ